MATAEGCHMLSSIMQVNNFSLVTLIFEMMFSENMYFKVYVWLGFPSNLAQCQGSFCVNDYLTPAINVHKDDDKTTCCQH